MGTTRIVPLLLAACLCRAGEVPFVPGANRFAFELFAKLAAEKGNVAFSPFSVSTALAMTYAGARNQTAREMAAVLHYPQDLHGPLGRLIDELNEAGRDEFDLAVANALWAQHGETFLPAFLDQLKTHYRSPLSRVDFAREEQARRTINRWVEQQTRDRIRNLIPPRLLTPNTVLVLTNALYFRGAWARPFGERATADLPFRLATGESVQVPTMRQTETFRYGEADGFQLLELPYAGRRIGMVVLLPRGDLPARLAGDQVAAMIEGMRFRAVRVALPRFKVTSAFSLADTLKEMGMPSAFGMGADFSGMNGERDLFIMHVLHKAFVDVHEKGTEAAAATAVVMGRKGRPQKPVEFRADRPFLFLIRDLKSGAILFLGRVSDPRQ